MTKRNPDVEWLRNELQKGRNVQGVYSKEWLVSVLAHIDQLEADLREARNEWKSARARAESLKDLLDHANEENEVLRAAERERGCQQTVPNVWEIRTQILAAIISSPNRDLLNLSWARKAECAYHAAEALIAEGRRRDEQR